jgi:hypothetical protein
MRITSQIDLERYFESVGGMSRGGFHGYPRLSLHGFATAYASFFHSSEWRPFLETLKCTNGRSLATGECQECEVGKMPERPRSNQSWNGRTLRMIPTSSADLNKRIRDIVARQAFHMSEARGLTPGHEMEDWKCAESAIVSPLCGGWTVTDGRIVVTAPASSYKEGVIEICVEPRRLAIFGMQRGSSGHNMLTKGRYDTLEKEIVRILHLPVEVDPSGATARFDHCMLEISLPEARSTRGIGPESRAA